jgi:rhodanese-related sulfurtransferase
MGVDAITVEQLAEWREGGVPHAVLDVREAHEVAICGIAGAIHIPMGQVPARMAELPADAPLVVMCHHGMRSARVVSFLRGAGLRHAVNLDGGIDAWAEQFDAAMRRY